MAPSMLGACSTGSATSASSSATASVSSTLAESTHTTTSSAYSRPRRTHSGRCDAASRATVTRLSVGAIEPPRLAAVAAQEGGAQRALVVALRVCLVAAQEVAQLRAPCLELRAQRAACRARVPFVPRRVLGVVAGGGEAGIQHRGAPLVERERVVVDAERVRKEAGLGPAREQPPAELVVVPRLARQPLVEHLGREQEVALDRDVGAPEELRRRLDAGGERHAEQAAAVLEPAPEGVLAKPLREDPGADRDQVLARVLLVGRQMGGDEARLGDDVVDEQ